MLSNLYKVYNVDTCKSAYITGYHLVKWLAHNTTLKAPTVKWAMRDLKQRGNIYIKRMSIDLVVLSNLPIDPNEYQGVR